MRYTLLIFLWFISLSLIAQTPEINITTKNGSDREKAVIPILKKLLKEYDLSKWVFTKDVIIEQFAIPHSHPVLTLSTRYGEEQKNDLLATFIHEQLHWYVEEKKDAEKTAIEEFRKKYKDVPYGNRAGARDEYSTYLHLIVCYLEYRSMADLIGEEEAKQLMWNYTHYTWVYNKIIEDADYISKVLKKNGLDLVE